MSYMLDAIHSYTQLPENVLSCFNSEAQLLLVLEDGDVELTCNYRKLHLEAGQLVLLQTNAGVHLNKLSSGKLRLFLLEMQHCNAGLANNSADETANPLFDYGHCIILQPHERQKIKELYALWQPNNRWSRMRAQSWFQQWAADVGERVEHAAEYDSASLVQDSMRYIEEHYQSPLTRKLLAEKTGFSEAYYSRFFKKNVGRSPQDYLTHIRIQKAKKLLVRQQSSIQAVAAQVGYSNPLYFSRIFKKTVGLSPTVYINMNHSRMRVAALNNQYTGHLLALGLEPCAATGPSFRSETPLLAHTLFLNSYEGGSPDTATLLRAEPDLILASEYTGEEHLEQLQTIAPARTIAFQNQDWRGHLMEIAQATGRQDQALSWLEEYDERSRLHAAKLRSDIGRASILSLLVRAQDCYVAGFRHMGAVLYQDLQLEAPPLIREQRGHYIADNWQMKDLDADYIMLVFHPSLTEADQQRWLNSPWWKAREAVKRNRVYYDQMNYVLGSYNAFSHQLLVDQAPQQLRSLSCI